METAAAQLASTSSMSKIDLGRFDVLQIFALRALAGGGCYAAIGNGLMAFHTATGEFAFLEQIGWTIIALGVVYVLLSAVVAYQCAQSGKLHSIDLEINESAGLAYAVGVLTLFLANAHAPSFFVYFAMCMIMCGVRADATKRLQKSIVDEA